MQDACPKREPCGSPGNFRAPFRGLSVCRDSLGKNRIVWGGIAGIHRAILMNCAAQAVLKSASEADFSLPIRCGFYQVSPAALSMPPERGTKVSRAAAGLPLRTCVPHSGQAGCIRAGAADAVNAVSAIVPAEL